MHSIVESGNCDNVHFPWAVTSSGLSFLIVFIFYSYRGELFLLIIFTSVDCFSSLYLNFSSRFSHWATCSKFSHIWPDWCLRRLLLHECVDQSVFCFELQVCHLFLGTDNRRILSSNFWVWLLNFDMPQFVHAWFFKAAVAHREVKYISLRCWQASDACVFLWNCHTYIFLFPVQCWWYKLLHRSWLFVMNPL